MLSLKTARRAALSPAELKAHLATSYPTPLILPHITKDWPACSSWTLRDDLSKLRSRIGEEKGVEFELGPRGRGYMDGRYRRVGMGFGLFLDAFILDKIPSSTPRSQQPVGYLAQYDIPLPAPPTDPARSISTVPPTPGGLTGTDGLAADLPYTPYMTTGPRSEAWRRTLWIGPRGTFTPFHKDPYIGIYTQLVGRKRFHLVPPSAAPHLAMSPRAPHTNTSTIPLSVDTISTTVSADDSAKMSARSAEQEHGSEAAADPDIDHDQDLSDIAPSMLEEYASLLHRAFAEAEACIATLEPGESVLIPEGWYHSAEGLEVGVGVNAWFR